MEILRLDRARLRPSWFTLAALLLILPGASVRSQTGGGDSKLVLRQPPRASTRMRLPEFFPDAARLSDVATRVSDALNQAGYTDQGWFVVPAAFSTTSSPAVIGFAVVTRLEQIEDTGRTKGGGRRWALDLSPSSSGSLLDAVKLLLQGAPDGRYRVFLLWVSNDPVSQIASHPSTGDWQDFLSQAAKAPLVRMMEGVRVNYGAGGGCYAFVYEYERSAISGETRYVGVSQLTAEQHLRASGIWDALAVAGKK